MYLKYVFALLTAVVILWVVTSCRSARKCEQSIDTLRVGIVDSDTIMFSVDGKDHLMIYKGEDKIVDEVYENGVLDQRLEMTDFLSKNEPFIIKDVTIGKQFHWEKKEDQVFNGKLQVIAKEGKLHAINIIPIEEYLKSVISSEMSAMNNLELLKAHTIISRSWVLRQVINSTKKMSSEQTLTDSNIENTDSVMRIIKFWDQEDHKYYDVCADDHCQRYQGITRQVSPLVEQAVNETRGEVLKDKDGNVCDARFSKCCGGKSELFSTCWQDTDYDYLQSVNDEFCNTSDSAVLKLVLNDYDQKTIDFHDWTVTYSQSEVSDLFEKKTQLGVGIIQDIIPLKRGASGRISLLRVVGSLKTVEIGKELMIRKAFSESHLYSSAFEVIKEGDSFTLKGCGWGHGVGLCQIGAACMSVKGYDYKQILSHYYLNSKIEPIY